MGDLKLSIMVDQHYAQAKVDLAHTREVSRLVDCMGLGPMLFQNAGTGPPVFRTGSIVGITAAINI